MANDEIQTAQPAPAPVIASAPSASVAEQAAKSIADVKTKGDFLRPLRYVKNFVVGTLRDSLDDMSHLGRLGFKAGIVGGAIAGIMGLGFSAAIIGAGIGLGIGAAVGGGYGLITGGYRAVMRQHRGEVYAEDLVQRKIIQQKAPVNRADYRDIARQNARARRQDIFAHQMQVRNMEDTRDFNTYWQDRVNQSGPGTPGIGY